MKKWLVCLLAALMLVAMTACGTQEAETPAPTEAPAKATEAPATPTEVPATPTVAPTEVPATPTPTPEPELMGIKDFFAQYGMKAGTCLSEVMVTKDMYSNVIKENFNSITFENHLKPDYTLDQAASKAAGEIVVKFSPATEVLLDWCVENGFAMRGHTLIWHSQTPTWIFHEGFDTANPRVGREEMLIRMESYIRQVFETLEAGGWLESFYAYDVLNEAWIDDGSMRPESLWLQTIGDDYMWYAFYYADKYAPDYIDLYYNDFNEQFKTEALYNFVQTLKDEDGNYLIDGIGFQAHLYTEDDLDLYFQHMDKMATLGLKINLTELDVCLGSYPVIKSATDANLKAQGQWYYNLIAGIIDRIEAGTVKMDALTIWGFTDTLSWRRERSPMPFNMAMKPKYALYGILQMKELAGFDE